MRLSLFITAIMAASALSSGAYALAPSGTPVKSKAIYGPATPQTQIDQALPGNYQAKAEKKKSGVEPLRGPWRLTKSLKNKGKEPADENGNTYACVDQTCKVSRKVDEKRD